MSDIGPKDCRILPSARRDCHHFRVMDLIIGTKHSLSPLGNASGSGACCGLGISSELPRHEQLEGLFSPLNGSEYGKTDRKKGNRFSKPGLPIGVGSLGRWTEVKPTPSRTRDSFRAFTDYSVSIRKWTQAYADGESVHVACASRQTNEKEIRPIPGVGVPRVSPVAELIGLRHTYCSQVSSDACLGI
ncbi:uncharacterized protein EI90DRAFT_3032639 [Cantharellus anzutake]|uniref:uncharacterized protein n=1 Tax=Cantharellus anzutake TaxID=1750568 RepID=UPI0019059CA8|nr:uncharacterized protein EI90DRAFT_3032639 [Cantharellus anzutake]KAF8342254.1 hypothetical protein EI90DRAFT_3032639 [Cantharellus anzutake]